MFANELPSSTTQFTVPLLIVDIESCSGRQGNPFNCKLQLCDVGKVGSFGNEAGLSHGVSTTPWTDSRKDAQLRMAVHSRNQHADCRAITMSDSPPSSCQLCVKVDFLFSSQRVYGYKTRRLRLRWQREFKYGLSSSLESRKNRLLNVK